MAERDADDNLIKRYDNEPYDAAASEAAAIMRTNSVPRGLPVRTLISSSAAILSFVTCATVLCLTSACSRDEGRAQHISIEEMVNSGQSLGGVRLRIEGCITSGPHGLVINECHSTGDGIPVLLSTNADRHAPVLYERGLVLEAGRRKGGVVALCGNYSQTPDGKDRWFEVDSFLMGGRAYGDWSGCGTDKKHWR